MISVQTFWTEFVMMMIINEKFGGTVTETRADIMQGKLVRKAIKIKGIPAHI